MRATAEREAVADAIRAAAGNLTRAAAALGCSRQTLYSRIYRHGLERLAGVSMARREELDRRENGTAAKATDGSGFEEAAPVSVTVKLPAALWKAARVAAIQQDTTVSVLVQAALEAALAGAEASS